MLSSGTLKLGKIGQMAGPERKKKGPPKGIEKTPGSGRKKGGLNLRTRQKQDAVEATLARLGVDPFEALALFVKGDVVALGLPACTELPLELRFDAAKELAGYLAPKKKAVEISGEGGDAVGLGFLFLPPKKSAA